MKHAFLILAHHNFKQLDTLIRLLDDPRIDIFLHIDKKSPKHATPSCMHSNVIKINSIRTNWGAYSLVECEIQLLKKALVTDNYSYFHLLSGQDLPIKTIEEILSFFDSHYGCNFVHFDCPEASIERNERVQYYHLFQEYRNRYKRTAWSVLDRIGIELQKTTGFDRRKLFHGEFKAGSQWWSITSELAEYVVSMRDIIKRHFDYTMCDEMFMQTIVYNSYFFDTCYIKEQDDQHANQRLIDFTRGHPYIWTIDDIEMIMASDLMFARKFDENIDNDVIEAIVQRVRPSFSEENIIL